MRMMLVAAASVAALMFAAACGGERTIDPPATVTPVALPEQGTVSGTVTYAEKIPLTPGARLEVRLSEFDRVAGIHFRNVTSRTISNPGQVPIAYELPYPTHSDRDRTYSVIAMIIESDGRLAFFGDGGFEGDSPDGVAQVDIHMSLEEPPPELAAQLDGDWETLQHESVDTPAPIIGAGYDLHGPNRTPPEHQLVIGFHRSIVPGCERAWYSSGEPAPRRDISPGFDDHRWAVTVWGAQIDVTIKLGEPPPLPWDNRCGEKLQEVWLWLPLPNDLLAGKTYTVTANGGIVSTFTVPSKPVSLFVPLESRVENVELIETEGPATRYTLRVTAGMPEGGRCTEFNGYEFQRTRPGVVNVRVTHYQLALACTQDYPVVVTDVPLDFIETGEDYVVGVNGGHRLEIRGG